MKYLIATLLFVGLTFTSNAEDKPAPKKLTCPIDDTKFDFTVDRGGEQTGMRLDFKPLGDMKAPWAIPQCPSCHFVLFNEVAEEPQPIEKEMVEKLKPYILSAEYKKIASSYPTYYCLGQIREFLKSKPLDTADAYLKASWQSETDSARNSQYLEKAYEAFVIALQDFKHGEPGYINLSLLCGELERRIGKFEEASKRMQFLKGSPAMQAPMLQEMIERQLEFISKKDTSPHSVDAEGEALVKASIAKDGNEAVKPE